MAISSPLIEEGGGGHLLDISFDRRIINWIGLVFGAIILGFSLEGIHLILGSGNHLFQGLYLLIMWSTLDFISTLALTPTRFSTLHNLLILILVQLLVFNIYMVSEFNPCLTNSCIILPLLDFSSTLIDTTDSMD